MSEPNDLPMGRKQQELPAPAARDEFDSSKLRPAEEVPIPPILFLEGGSRRTFFANDRPEQPTGPTERELLWAELDSLIDRVKAHGINSLTPYEFALYELLLPMFRNGQIDTQYVLMRFRRRFKTVTDELLAEYERACRFAMRPSTESLDVTTMVKMHRDSSHAHGYKVDGEDEPTTSDPEA